MSSSSAVAGVIEVAGLAKAEVGRLPRETLAWRPEKGIERGAVFHRVFPARIAFSTYILIF
jgi:hypothetical protein